MPDRSHCQISSPGLWELACQFPRLRGDRLAMLAHCFERHGDRFRLALPGAPVVLFTRDAEDIKHVLVSNQANYHKNGPYLLGPELFGQGLLSSEDELHHHQRRMLQPMFLQKKLATFGELMSNATEGLLSRWQDGENVNISQEMMRLTISIVGLAMFGVDLAPASLKVNDAFTVAQRHVAYLDAIWLPRPKFMMARRTRQYRQAIAQLKEVVDDIVAQGRRRKNGHDDALSTMFIGKTAGGAPLAGQQIFDEIQTMMLAGHETTANALCWIWYRLSQHPEVETKLHAELREVLGGRPPTLADLPKLQYAEMVFSETLRMYPPVWMIGRLAVKEDRLPCGLDLPAGQDVAIPAFCAHRNPRYYPDPERFDPERFHPSRKQERPQFAYFPFGGGARSCIGEPFARMEAILILATIAQRYRLVPDAGQKFDAEPLLTYRLPRGILMRAVRRDGTETFGSRAVPTAHPVDSEKLSGSQQVATEPDGCPFHGKVAF